MNFFTFAKLGRMLLLSAVLSVAAICWVGCGGNKDASSSGKSEQGAASKKADALKDDRDGQEYRTVKIGDQVWMAKNLNIETVGSFCYENNPDNCAKYGRLYTWAAAMKVCPSGWHLPSREEWEALVKAAGGTGDYGTMGNAGKALKSTSGWEKFDGNGTDIYGFSALPGGGRNDGGDFNDVGEYGNWWTASENADFTGNAYYWHIYHDFEHVALFNDGKDYGFSVRCVQDK